MNNSSTNLVKVPEKAINQQALLNAVADYNKLTNVPIISNLERECLEVAESFCRLLKDLSDADADLLNDTTIDMYNFLVSPFNDESLSITDDANTIVEAEETGPDDPVTQEVSKPKPKSEKSMHKDASPSKNKAASDPFEKFLSPKATTLIMACVVEGITDKASILNVLEDNGLKAAENTINLTVSNTRAVMDYIKYLDSGQESICKIPN